jgi:hypothetical protein
MRKLALIAWIAIFGLSLSAQSISGGMQISGITMQPASLCGPPNYCARTDFLAATVSMPPPQVGPNTCSSTTPWTCGNSIGAGNVFTDPNFATSIMRVTDTTTGKTGVLFQGNVVDSGGSSDNNHFSCDESMIFVSDTGSWNFPMNFFGMSAAPTKMYATTLSASNGFFFTGGAAWGRNCPSHAHTLYFLTGTQLQHYDFTGNTPSGTPPSGTLDYDFTSSANCLGAGFVETYEVEGESNATDTDFAVGFSNNGGQGGVGTLYIAVYRVGSGCRVLNVGTDSVTGDWGPTGAIPGTPCTGTIHNVKILKGSTGWLIWTITNPSAGCSAGGANNQQWLWNYAAASLTGSLTPMCYTECSGHFTEGLTTLANNPGNDVPNYFDVRTVTTIASPIGITPTNPTSGALDWHCGWTVLNDALPFWCESDRTTGLPDTTAWDDEIVGFQPFANGVQYREASTNNTNLNPNFSAAIAVSSPSPFGDYMLFTSDWRNTLGGANSNGSSGSSTCIPNGPNWVASTTYASGPYASSFPANGGIITPTSNTANPGGYSYQAIVPGISGTSEPSLFSQTIGGTTTDGIGSPVTWQNIGAQSSGSQVCRSDVFVVQLH